MSQTILESKLQTSKNTHTAQRIKSQIHFYITDRQTDRQTNALFGVFVFCGLSVREPVSIAFDDEHSDLFHIADPHRKLH